MSTPSRCEGRRLHSCQMSEITHVRIEVPEQAKLNRLLREGGAQAFPQFLYAEPGTEPRIVWWGVRGAELHLVDVPDDPARAGLFPRANDDWTETPRGLILATVDLDRAQADLSPALGNDWFDCGEDAVLGATCRRLPLGRGMLVLAQPITEGYAAACLARFGEGPIAVALDGTSSLGTDVTTNPVSDGPASWVRIGPRTAPYLLFLPAR
jgi:hypothetical protein